MPNSNSFILFLYFLVLLSLPSLNRATICVLVGACHASGYLTGQAGFCTTQNDASCCQAGQQYPQYRCSPPVTNNTEAILNVGGFSQGSDGGGATECDSKRCCLKKIRINGNGKSVLATVVDECDSVNGCTANLNYEPPCPNDVINATPGVWEALGIPTSKDEASITWSDA